MYTFVYDQTIINPGPAQQEIVPQHLEKRSKAKCTGLLSPHSTQMRSLRGRGDPAKLSGQRPAHGNESFFGANPQPYVNNEWGVVRGAPAVGGAIPEDGTKRRASNDWLARRWAGPAGSPASPEGGA